MRPPRVLPRAPYRFAQQRMISDPTFSAMYARAHHAQMQRMTQAYARSHVTIPDPPPWEEQQHFGRTVIVDPRQ